MVLGQVGDAAVEATEEVRDAFGRRRRNFPELTEEALQCHSHDLGAFALELFRSDVERPGKLFREPDGYLAGLGLGCIWMR